MPVRLMTGGHTGVVVRSEPVAPAGVRMTDYEMVATTELTFVARSVGSGAYPRLAIAA